MPSVRTLIPRPDLLATGWLLCGAHSHLYLGSLRLFRRDDLLGILIATLAVLATLILAPAVQNARAAEVAQNDIQASLDRLDRKIALQKQFLAVATTDPLVMQRLAERQFNLQRRTGGSALIRTRGSGTGR